MTQDETDVLAQQLAAPLISRFSKAKKRFASQNRDAWKRMNRPSKSLAIESGMSKINALIARFKV